MSAVPICTTVSTMMCPHGGTVLLTTSNTKAKINGSPALLVTDIHTVVGCPFTLGVVYHPCVTVRWSNGAMQTKVDGTAVLLQTSIGTCYAADQAPQGLAVIMQVDPTGKGS